MSPFAQPIPDATLVSIEPDLSQANIDSAQKHKRVLPAEHPSLKRRKKYNSKCGCRLNRKMLFDNKIARCTHTENIHNVSLVLRCFVYESVI